MKNQSKPRVKLALRTETVRALSASQLTDVVGGDVETSVPGCKSIRVTVTLLC